MPNLGDVTKYDFTVVKMGGDENVVITFTVVFLFSVYVSITSWG